ncbi:MAG: hypothetical protein K0A94_11120 [Desulfuromonadales bacterium]|nr:hypothetical protein [Desulfuromonadales bacterium]
MIAIDINVLLRYLLEDDAHQFQKAAKLIFGQQKVLVTDVVLVETIWTLRGKKYQLNKDELVAVLQSLFQEPNIRFEDGQAVWVSLTNYRNAKPVKGKEADVTDALIINKSKQVATKEKKLFEGLQRTARLDRSPRFLLVTTHRTRNAHGYQIVGVSRRPALVEHENSRLAMPLVIIGNAGKTLYCFCLNFGICNYRLINTERHQFGDLMNSTTARISSSERKAA